MDHNNDLKYIYENEFADIQQAQDGMGHLIWEDIEYVKNGQTVKVAAFPLTDISTFKELAYYNKHWEKHKQDVTTWLEWFQSYIGGMMDVDDKWMKQNEKERWDGGEIGEDYEGDFEDWWEEYDGSEGYWEEVSFLQQTAWDDLKSEFGWIYETIDSVVGGDWLDSYDNLNTHRMDDGLEDAFNIVEELVQELFASAYEPDDFDEEGLTEHFDEIFE